MLGNNEGFHKDPFLSTVRTIGRVSQIITELRAEYERRPNPATLAQIRHRIRELAELERQLDSDDILATG